MSYSNGGPISISPNVDNDNAEDECDTDERVEATTEPNSDEDDVNEESTTEGAADEEQCHPVGADIDVESEEAEADVDDEAGRRRGGR